MRRIYLAIAVTISIASCKSKDFDTESEVLQRPTLVDFPYPNKWMQGSLLSNKNASTRRSLILKFSKNIEISKASLGAGKSESRAIFLQNGKILNLSPAELQISSPKGLSDWDFKKINPGRLPYCMLMIEYSQGQANRVQEKGMHPPISLSSAGDLALSLGFSGQSGLYITSKFAERPMPRDTAAVRFESDPKFDFKAGQGTLPVYSDGLVVAKLLPGLVCEGPYDIISEPSKVANLISPYALFVLGDEYEDVPNGVHGGRRVNEK